MFFHFQNVHVSTVDGAIQNSMDPFGLTAVVGAVVLTTAAVGRLLRSRQRGVWIAEMSAPPFSDTFVLEGENAWVGTWQDVDVSVQAFSDAKGIRLECAARIHGRVREGFVVSRRDPRRHRSAPLGVERLDEWLQVQTAAMHTPEDMSWLAGQGELLHQTLHPPQGMEFLQDPDVADALEALLPMDREGSYVNTTGVFLVDRGSVSVEHIRDLLDDVVALVVAVDRAIDPWDAVGQRLGLTVSAHDAHGDRTVSGRHGAQHIRAHVVADEDGNAQGMEVHVGPVHTGVRVHAGQGGIPLRNIVLQDRVCIEGVVPEGLAARLDAPDAAGDLLSIFGQWPMSTIENGSLCVRIPTLLDADELVDVIESALRCVVRVG